jgi:phenylacetic acid degradation operon negative regulatory protein
MPTLTQERIDAFRQQGRLRSGSLIVSVFGDAVLPRGGRIWLGSLIELLAPLGLNERLVRTSVYRLAQDAWLASEVQGRRTNYQLTPAGCRRFEEAARHIYAATSPPWDHRWRLVLVVGALDTAAREQLRRALFWHGFGDLGADCFVHPSADLGALFDALSANNPWATPPHLLPLVAANPRLLASANDTDLVNKAWNLAQLADSYRAFVDRYTPLLAEWPLGADSPHGPTASTEAFLLRTLLIHDYRRLLLRDPELPDVLLPKHWPGHDARALCRELYRRLLPLSEQHLDTHLRLASGEVPTASALLVERFMLDDPLLR